MTSLIILQPRTGSPVSVHPQCLPSEKFKIACLKFEHMLQEEPSDIYKTAIIMPFCLFEFLHILDGIHNAAKIIQKFIEVY